MISTFDFDLIFILVDQGYKNQKILGLDDLWGMRFITSHLC